MEYTLIDSIISNSGLVGFTIKRKIFIDGNIPIGISKYYIISGIHKCNIRRAYIGQMFSTSVLEFSEINARLTVNKKIIGLITELDILLRSTNRSRGIEI